MNPQIDFSGFYYRTDRVHEYVSDLLDKVRDRHPEIEGMEILIKRSFFGTYSTRVAGTVHDERIDVFEQSGDPVECFERCLDRFREHAEAAKSRLAFAGLL